MALVLLIMLATMMLPEEIIAIPLSLVLADMPVLHVNLIGTYAGMILPVGAWGFSILVMTEFMKEVPVELEEAARLDGAGELRIFFVGHPAAVPARARRDRRLRLHHDLGPVPAAADRGPRVGQWTLPIALRSLRADEQVGLGVLLAAALLALLPSVIAFLAFQRQFMRGLTSGAVKG